MKPAFYTQHAPHQRKDLSHWGNYRSAITECNRSSVLMVKRKKEHHKKKIKLKIKKAKPQRIANEVFHNTITRIIFICFEFFFF